MRQVGGFLRVLHNPNPNPLTICTVSFEIKGGSMSESDTRCCIATLCCGDTRMARRCTRSSLPNYFVMTSYHWNTGEIRWYSLFRGYSFNISGNFKVHVSLKKHCRSILQLHWKWSNSNMILVGERQQITWCLAQNVVYLRVVSKFVNFNSTLVICFYWNVR
jgi:hypothetical protein